MEFDAFLVACGGGDLVRVREGLSQDGVDLKQVDRSGRTPLMVAAEKNQIEVARLLIERSDVQQVDRNGDSALILAVAKGHTEMTKLLRPGSNVQHISNDGGTALGWAVFFNSTEMVKVVVEGSDCRQVDRNGNSALHWGVFHDNLEIVKLLVNGSDLRQEDGAGMTALMSAVELGHVEIVKRLIEKSDLAQRSTKKRKKTAFELAMHSQQWHCADCLACADPELDTLPEPWAGRTGPEQLPQWFARQERKELETLVDQTDSTKIKNRSRGARSRL